MILIGPGSVRQENPVGPVTDKMSGHLSPVPFDGPGLGHASNVEHGVTVPHMDLMIHNDPRSVAAAAAERIAGLVASADGKRFSLGLAGGSTPGTTYAALREHPTDWSNVDAWLSDERWVPHHHDRSNGRQAAEALLDHVHATFHRPVWNEHDPEISAASYEAQIRSIHPGRLPELVLLGMGHDGHTASLFPGTAALNERERWVVANEVPQHRETRITATYPLLWAAEHVIFLVVGAGKAEALRDSFAGKTPAGKVGEGDAQVEWHVDTAAASLLS